MTLVYTPKAQPPIVTTVCKEPEGIIVRYVYPLILTPENLQTFWLKAKKFPTVFGTEVNDFKTFCELFLSQEGDTIRAHGLFWVIDDFVGVYYLTHMTNTDALVHYSFFDKRHTGREELTKEMLRYVFRRFGFWRLSAEIPEYATNNTYGFTHALGFQKEGFKRNALLLKGVKRKVNCFGLTREEGLKEPDNNDS